MRLLLIGLVLALGAIAGGAVLSRSHVSLPNKLTSFLPAGLGAKGTSLLPAQASVPNLPQSGNFTGQVSNISHGFGGTVGTIAQDSIDAGQKVLGVLTSTPSASTQVIDVGQAVSQIRANVENVPANLLQQARLEYCRQVLQDATASAQK